MKKNLLIGLAALAAVTITSCQKDQVINQVPQEQAIEFGTYVGRDAQTKATVTNLNTLKLSDGFGVYAYYTQGSYNNTTSPANFMLNQNVNWVGVETGTPPVESTENGNWTYTPLKYWPNNSTDKLSFFAYAPYTALNASQTENITSLPNNTTVDEITTAPSGDPKIEFKVATDVEDQVDLLYANALIDQPKPNVGTKTTFNFNHALSRISFSAQAMIDAVAGTTTGNQDDNITGASNKASETTITIKSISLNGDFYKEGTLNLNTGAWNKTGSLSNYTIENLTKNITNEIQENITGFMMIIPDDYDGDNKKPITITVTYDVITTDAALAGGTSTVTNTITSESFNINFQKGKAYNFALHLGLNSVQFNVDTITEWNETGNDIAVNVPINNN